MTDETTIPDPCAAAFSVLAFILKAQGLKAEGPLDGADGQGLTPEEQEEQLVRAYLHRREQTRTPGWPEGAAEPDIPAGHAAQDTPDGPAPGGKDAHTPDTAETGADPDPEDREAAPPPTAMPGPADMPEPPGAGTQAGPVPSAAPEPVSLPDAQAKTPRTAPPLKGHAGQDTPDDPAPDGTDAHAPDTAETGANPDPKDMEAVCAPTAVAGPADIPERPGTGPQATTLRSAPPEPVSLPNARAKTPYAAPPLKGYSSLRMHNDNGTGLVLGADGSLSAESMQAGEYTIDLSGLKDGRRVSVRARLSVIPRPKDLWISIPSDQNAPLAKPDEAFEQVEGEAFLVAASTRGRSHAREGTYRDDHFALSYDAGSGWHVMVVADGAGSAPASREGSRVACETACRALQTLLPEEVDPVAQALVQDMADSGPGNNVPAPVVSSLMRAARTAAQELEACAQKLACPVAHLSTTLAIAAARKVNRRWLLLSFSVGDGGIGLWDGAAGAAVLMCRPDSGEFAGQTRFLTLGELDRPHGGKSRVFAEIRDSFTAFMAMTDGITDPKFETDAAFANPARWRTFWEDDLTKAVTFAPDNAAIREQFLEWMEFWSRGNHDDRTLAVMVPKEPAPATERTGESP
ncbi:MAG: protein phosphatase 2C domain-containing protein [Rhodobacteraceae bacterium]|nr:protein phosphatase 2C domain-containing protein [Paracoccaceae bacterium]